MEEYRRDLFWAQRYAMKNREAMLGLYEDALRRFRPDVVLADPVLCHHNYVAEETHFGEEVLVTRKGAIRAGKGELGIIPGSMGTRSFIVRGLGSQQSFESASHGAGRKMSRGEARRRFSVKDLEAQTRGRGVPQGRRRDRRDPGSVQAHRAGDGKPEGPGRGGGGASPGPLREGLKHLRVVVRTFMSDFPDDVG